ncbi:MAG: LLM class flavin-dependent oxidoreductase [Caldilineaceae bacterium]
MSQRFRLGFLTHLEGSGDPRQIYQETLEWFVAADELGFDVGWIAQHHFHIHPGRLPSPFPFLAAAAQRTKHIRLGTSIVVMPLELPLRVAEDAAVVDALSDGRLELGIGSGGERGEFEAFGLDMARRRELTSDGVQMLQRALRGESLNASEQRLDPPAPTLVNRLWQSALSPTGVQYVAQQGSGLLLSRAAWEEDKPTDQVQAPLAKAYLAAWQDKTIQPRVGLSRGIYPTTDKRTALAALREPVLRTMQKQRHVPSDQPLEYYCHRMHIAYGNSEEVAAYLAADQALPYATDLILQFNPVSPPLDQALRMLEQIATEVAPALGWKKAGANN